MRNPAFYICKTDTDQLCCNRTADQHLCFCYIDSTIFRNFKPLAILCGCTDRFVPDLVGNPEDRFSHDESHMCFKCYR